MRSAWHRTTIGEQVQLQRGYDITRLEQRPGTIPVVSSGGIASFHDTACASGPGVVLGRKGVVGSVYYVADDFWPHDTTLWVKDFKGNDPRFVYYFFRHKAPLLASLDVGSANPTLNRNHVHPTPVLWPQHREQVAIAAVLSALDDKIELNRQMNETLEAMARALFKSWFVDFDPVRAKMAGRAPFGMDAATAALFPSSFHADLPAAWRVGALVEVTRSVRRGLGPAYLEKGGVCVLNQKCIRDGRVDFTRARRHDPNVRAVDGRELVVGDVLVNSTGVGTLGRVAALTHLAEPSIVDSHVTVVRADESIVLPSILGLDLRGREAEIEGLGEGSTGQTELARERLGKLLITIPPMPVQRVFDAQMQAIVARGVVAQLESATLAELRDLLLPKLLSGELRIKDAEKAVAAVL